jgi:lysophospholipase L1-like esterase
MKYITIVGDSHAEGLASGFCEFARINNVNIKTGFVLYKGECAYNVDYNETNIHDLTNDIILANFGENDCRRKLPKYKNAEETAKKYIEKTLSYFKDNRVIFIQPSPQALDELTHEFQFSKKNFYPLAERLEQQRIFNDALAKYDGIEVINMKDAIGLEIGTEKDLQDGCHLNRDNTIALAAYINNYLDKTVD